MILFLIDLYKMENTCVNIIKIWQYFRSLFFHDSIIKTFCSREQSTSQMHTHNFIELKKNNDSCKIVGFWQGFEKRFEGVCFVFFGFFVQLFWPFYRRVRLFIRSVHAFTLSWSSSTAKKSFFWQKIVFRKKYWNLILVCEGHTDARKTSADRRMIAIVDDEELEKTKGISNTANDTRINTLWAVRVWFESAEERT